MLQIKRAGCVSTKIVFDCSCDVI